MKDFFEKPILWVLLGFGVASIIFFFLDMTKSSEDHGAPMASYSMELQEISSHLLHVSRTLEDLQAQMTARAIKDEQFILAMSKMEKLVVDEIGKLSPAHAAQVMPPSQRVSPQQTANVAAVNIDAKGLEGVQPPSAIELRVQPKGETAVQVTKAAVQKKPEPFSPSPDASASSAPKTYAVQPGDTLFSIARANEVPLASLLEANDLKEDAMIRVGQTLVIPK